MSLRERSSPTSGLSKEKSPSKKKLARSAGAITLLAGLTGCTTVENGFDESGSCPSVSKAEIASVQNVLNRPDNPLVRKTFKNNVLTSEYSSYVAEQAKKHELTVIDYEPYAKRLVKAESVTQMLSIVNKFSSHYDLKVEIDTGNNSEGGYKDAKPFKTINSVDKEKFKYGAFSYMYSLHYSPVEYVKESGVKNIRIEDSLKDDIKIGKRIGSALGLHTGNDIYLKDDAFYKANIVVFHELFHGVDFQICGNDYAKDRKFTKANPKNFQYGSENDDGVGIVVVDSYGKTSVKEDKATISEFLFPFITPNVFQMKGPMKEKSKILLARIQKKVAEENKGADYVGYLRAISTNTKDS